MLAVHIDARRVLLFDRFVELWGELERDGTWDDLERVLEEKVRQARERRLAAERAERAARELERAERAEREAAERARLAAEALVEARRAQPTPPG